MFIVSFIQIDYNMNVWVVIMLSLGWCNGSDTECTSIAKHSKCCTKFLSDKDICTSMKQQLEDNQHAFCIDFNSIIVQPGSMHLLLEEQVSIRVGENMQYMFSILEHI